MSDINPPPAGVPASTPLSSWLDRLAQPDGEPGGGAASGVVLALAAALLRMVATYTTDSPDATASADRLVDRRRDALAEAEADGQKSAELGAALRTSTDDPARDDRVRDAAVGAAQSSASLGEVGVALLDELRLLEQIGNPHLAADLGVAAEALAAGLAGASINLRANLQLARRHRTIADEAETELDTLRAAAARLQVARAAASDIAARASAGFDE